MTGRPKFTPLQKDEILARHLSGEPLKTIQEAYGCCISYPTVLARRSRLHKRRKRGRKPPP